MRPTLILSDSKRLLVVGLGNPSPQYDRTRHNVGNWFIEQLTQHHWNDFSSLKPEPKFSSFQTSTTCHSDYSHIVLTKLTACYMNLAGRPIKKFWDCFQEKSKSELNLLIIHDELELPLGKAQIRNGNTSARGHNGLKSVSACVGTKFMKMGIGIGRPARSSERGVADYVLTEFNNMETAKLKNHALEHGIRLLEEMAEGKHLF